MADKTLFAIYLTRIINTVDPTSAERMVKVEGEVYPLLTTDWLGTPTYRQKPVARYVRQDDDDEEIQVYEDDEEVFDIIDQKKKRSVNLVWMDVALLVLDFLQIFALIQSMATRWVYPETWLRKMYWVFGLNLDVWEIYKFQNESTYASVQGAYLASTNVPVSYENIMLAWFGVFGGIAIFYAALHFSFRYFWYPQSWARRVMSWIQFVFMIIIHVLSLPIGTVMFRIFQCEADYSKVYTINDYTCFSVDHWKLAAPAVIILTLVFIIYPAFLVWKIRQEGMTGTSHGYLAFILMKETEYKIHLNRSWLNDAMWIFSSYKHRGRYYRTTLQIVKLILLIIFASAFQHINIQAMVTTIWLLLVFIIAILIRPFRLTSCNAFLAFSILCNMGNSFIGSLISAYTSYTIPSAWLTAEYLVWFIAFIQASWTVSLVALLVYLVSRTCCHSTKSCYKRPVWPNIATSGSGNLTSETKKFMTAIIKAKIAHEKIQRVSAVFAPVHVLARHIHVINTYCREAEYTHDALHMVLWEVLDDLVESHANIAPRSLFAESVKKSIRRTAAEFMKLVPMFSQRLAQRDYDMILVPPHKKRMLLKMYIMGLFLNGRSEKLAKRNLLQPALEKVWPTLPSDRQFEEEDGYYEDLYPEPIGGNYSDDLLNEEDNVQGMLRRLPDVGLIDLETPMIEDPMGGLDSDEDNMVKSSSSDSDAGPAYPRSTSPSLFGSKASLRRDVGSPGGSSHHLSPRPPSAGSAHSSRAMSPAGQKSGSSVVSSQPSLQGSAVSLSEREMAEINPGYVPDPEEEGEQPLPPAGRNPGEDNPAFEGEGQESDDDEPIEITTATEDDSKEKKKKKRKTKKAKKE
ncbi:hypothetical protein MAR_037116 [Mya arenaria]|uniref:Uncharacterized protein n=1 Tax=Mya arenaria TaxID=6604 RepID=A0ABY7FPB4_MYAAR|nr:hypothetical protein MAR_037116 [Mya arenaria]